MLALPSSRLRGTAAAPPPPALDREPVAAQDGPGQQASALLTLAFLSVKEVVADDKTAARRGG
jgi:hypothetical protein